MKNCSPYIVADMLETEQEFLEIIGTYWQVILTQPHLSRNVFNAAYALSRLKKSYVVAHHHNILH